MVINIILIVIAVGIVALDQISKMIVSSNMEIGQAIDIIPGLFRLNYITNPGMSFSLFSEAGQRWIFMIISPIALIAIAVYLFKFSKDKLTMKLGLAFIFAGGFSNMIDRTFYGDKLFHGEVIDMFDFYGIWNAIFNVADSFVCIGATLVVCTLLYEIYKEQKNKKKAAEVKAQELNEKMSGVVDITPTDEEMAETKIASSYNEATKDTEQKSEDTP